MSLNTEQMDLIQKYLRDALSVNEKATFDKNLENEAFKAVVMEQAKVLNALELGDDALVRERLASLKPQVEHSGNGVIKNPSNKRRTILLLLLSIALLIAGWFLVKNINQPSQTEQLFAEHHQTYPVDGNKRNGALSMDPDYKAAMNAYAAEDYKKALNMLDALDYQDDRIFIYSGACQLELGQIDAAIVNFKKLSASTDKEFKESSDWYLAEAYLRKGASSELDVQLYKIISDPDHIYFNSAKALKVDTKKLSPKK